MSDILERLEELGPGLECSPRQWGVIVEGMQTIERLREALKIAESDRDVLAAEVRAWRHFDDVYDCVPPTDRIHRVNINAHDRACGAAQATDASGALTRAGGEE